MTQERWDQHREAKGSVSHSYDKADRNGGAERGNEGKGGLLNKDVTVSVNIGSILKFVFLVAILGGVFMLGRWSVGDESAGMGVDQRAVAEVNEKGLFSRMFEGLVNAGSSGATVVETRTSSTENEEGDEGANESVSVVQDGGSESGLAEQDLQANVTVNVEEVQAGVSSAEAASGDAESVPAEEEEKVITEYPAGTAAFSILGIQKEWYDTWGKIIRLEISVKNNAAGIIKAKYITMTVEGYDFDKRVPLVDEGVVAIKAGATKNMFVFVPGGFAYNKLTTGDLKSVRITAVLFDEKDKQIAAENRDFDLEVK